MEKAALVKFLQGYKSISIIGMDKNVGKTTVLNYLVKKSRGKIPLGLTSIGRDGEDIDRVTSTEKPKVYIERGTLIATAKQCLFNGDITREIIETTGISTPMGEVIIARALSDGFIELGGPSINSYVLKVCSKLKKLGSELVIVDGAISRKSSACPTITEAAILSTGASVDRNIDKVIEKTVYTIKNLSIGKENNGEILKCAENVIKDCRLAIIQESKEIKKIDVTTALEGSRKIVERLDEKSKYIVLKGILSDNFLKNVMKYSDKVKNITLLVEDGTKIFLEKDTLHKFKKIGGRIKVINPINIVCVTINPTSPYGYEFDKDEFIYKLRKQISIPVIDVIGGD
ncbi:hypothetical protein ACFIJ5_00805 [Haloimpatiens sp. FM7330]|uniref:lysine 5,6-aminomutase reactivase subunit KamB n=1 Tax=Haloimpatiens sp. FM7330 TaxID=3298610 RepID=UPI00363D02D8